MRSPFHVRVLPSGVAITDGGVVVVNDAIPNRVAGYFGLAVSYDGLTGTEQGFIGSSPGTWLALAGDQQSVYGGEYDTVRLFLLDPTTSQLTFGGLSPQQSFPRAVEYVLHALPDGQHLVSRGGRLHPGIGVGLVLDTAHLFDWDNDGRYDSNWTNSPVAFRRLTVAGSPKVTVQVKDRFGATHQQTRSVTVTQAGDPGVPAGPHTPFQLSFPAKDMAFNPNRPIAYVADLAGKRIVRVNLEDGLAEREFLLDKLPQMFGLTPDGSRLYAVLWTAQRPSFNSPAYLAEFDLGTGVKNREITINRTVDLLMPAGDQTLVAVVNNRELVSYTWNPILEVRDRFGATGVAMRPIDVARADDPGQVPSVPNTPFELPFAATDAVFDPARPHLYATDLAGKRLVRMNLQTGLVDREFVLDNLPNAVAIAGDARTLCLTLLRQPNYSTPPGLHKSFIAYFDLERGVRTHEFPLSTVSHDLVISSLGYGVVSTAGSAGVRCLRLQDGAELYSGAPFVNLRLAIHPNQSLIYGVTYGSSGVSAFRFDCSKAVSGR